MIIYPTQGRVSVICHSCQTTIWAQGRSTFWTGIECPETCFQHDCGGKNKRPSVYILMGVEAGYVTMPLVVDGARGSVDIGLAHKNYT